MPLTFSHPALILPLARLKSNYISMTGLVVGSMAPDFEYFFRMEAYSSISHSLLGILYFDLPITILLSIVFHLIIKGPLIANLPGYFRNRSYPLVNYSFLNYLKNNKIAFIVSAIIGSSSHIFWDGFTYVHGYFVEAIPILSIRIAVGAFSFGIYKYVQYGSTLLGGFLILLFIHFLPKGKSLFPGSINYGYWLIILVVTIVVAYRPVEIGFTTNRVANYAVTLITGGLLGILLASLIFWLRNPAKYRPVSISNS